MIPDEYVDSFIALYKQEYGDVLTQQEAITQIIKLIELMKALYWEE
jgi:hypothetical protein